MRFSRGVPAYLPGAGTLPPLGWLRACPPSMRGCRPGYRSCHHSIRLSVPGQPVQSVVLDRTHAARSLEARVVQLHACLAPVVACPLEQAVMQDPVRLAVVFTPSALHLVPHPGLVRVVLIEERTSYWDSIDLVRDSTPDSILPDVIDHQVSVEPVAEDHLTIAQVAQVMVIERVRTVRATHILPH